MAKIFSLSPSGLVTSGASVQGATPSSSYSLSTIDDSPPNTPVTPLSPIAGPSPLSTIQQTPPTLTKTQGQHQKKKRLSTDLSKIVLSFFLSPTGYRLLRFDHRKAKKSNYHSKGKGKKEDESSTKDQIKHDNNNNNTSNTSKRPSKTGATSLPANETPKQRLQRFFIDPEEYNQWFK